MLQKYIDTCRKNKLVGFASILTLSYILYLCNITFVLVLVLPLMLTIGLRFPDVAKSLFARFMISIFFLYSAIQVAATFQFLLFPQSDFRVLALFISLICLVLVVVLPSRTKEYIERKPVYVSHDDIFALLCAAVFALPILIIAIFGKGTLLGTISGIQGIDGMTHFADIAQMSFLQHFTYTVNGYYPLGFHISTAFIERGLNIMPGFYDWLTTARIYVGEYALFGGIFLYGLYYFALSLTRSLFKRDELHAAIKIGMALAIGGIVTALYLMTFTYDGFLSYFYVCAAVIFAILYLFDTKDSTDLKTRHMSATAFLFIALGVSMSWPLWTPALLLVTLFFSVYKLKFTKKDLVTWEAGALVVTALLHFVPIYFQLKYNAPGDVSQGINLQGGLRTFHTLVLGGGILLLIVVIVQKKIQEEGKQLLQQLFIPMLLMLSLLACMQYFLYGEVRYYTIKTSLLVEILLIVVFVVVIASAYAEHQRTNKWYAVVLLPLALFMSVVLLMSVNGNPLQDASQLFRNVSKVPKPAFFDNDIAKFTSLGEAGKIVDANVLSMHVNDAGKLYTHMQVFYWADMMQYTGSPAQRRDLAMCSGMTYAKLFAQDFSDAAQKKLIALITSCALYYKSEHLTYYIVTDDSSKAYLENMFGNVATVL